MKELPDRCDFEDTAAQLDGQCVSSTCTDTKYGKVSAATFTQTTSFYETLRCTELQDEILTQILLFCAELCYAQPFWQKSGKQWAFQL